MTHAPSREDLVADVALPERHALHRLPTAALLVGLVGLVATGVMGMGDRHAFAFSYLVAFLYFLSFALGALIFVLIQFAARAGWSVLVRRVAENTMATLPLFAVLFLPVAACLHDLYHWSHADAVAHDPILQAKAPYLNVGFFYVRAALILGAWSVMSWWFVRQSVRQDGTGDELITRRMQRVAGPCIVLFAFTTTFAAFDWAMSVEPHWYSTIFGGYFFAGALVGFLALLLVTLMLLQVSGVLARSINAEHYHDLGKLLFGFTVFWAYIAFSQYMLIWYGNIPEETVWYQARFTGSWKTVSLALMIGHFIVPFFYLMPRTIKRSRPALFAGAAWLLVMHYVDIYWLVMPTHSPGGAHPTLLDACALLGVGGVFVAAMAWVARRHALVPVRDPRLHESVAFENA